MAKETSNKHDADRPHASEAGQTSAAAGGETAPGGLAKQLGWFVLLWLAGVAAVGTVAFAIRTVLIG